MRQDFSQGSEHTPFGYANVPELVDRATAWTKMGTLHFTVPFKVKGA